MGAILKKLAREFRHILLIIGNRSKFRVQIMSYSEPGLDSSSLNFNYLILSYLSLNVPFSLDEPTAQDDLSTVCALGSKKDMQLCIKFELGEGMVPISDLKNMILVYFPGS